MNHSYFSIRSISKTLVIAAVFAVSLAVVDYAQAATPQLRVKNTGGSFATSVRAEPGDTLIFQMFGNNTSSGAFSVTLPSDLTYSSNTSGLTISPAASASVNGQTITWNFTTNSFQVIQFRATVVSGSSLSTNHSLSVSFTTDGVVSSDTATVTTGPIVTSITPSSCNNSDAVAFNNASNGDCPGTAGIAGHGFTGTTAVVLSLNGTTADHTFDIAGATITDTLIYGPNIRVPASFTPGAYWVLVTVTSSGNTLTTNGDSTETVRFTSTDGIPPTMNTSANTYIHSSGILTLIFDETIDVSATVPSKITLADASSGGNSITLTNAAVSTTDSATVTFTLSQADINTISTWGQSVNTLYVHIAGDGIFDTSANPLSNQGSRTALNTWTKDTAQPTAAITYTQNSATVASAKVGTLTITATFNEPIASTPQIAINQQGTTDIAATNLTLSGTDRTIWTYSYTVNLDDAAAYVDGSAAVTISSATDYAGLTLASQSNGTFTIDTLVPSPAITTLAGASSGQTAANFSWTPTYSASDFSTYKFYWRTMSGVTSANGTLIDENTSGYLNLGTSSTASLSISSLSAGTNYYAVIYICDSASNCSGASNEVNVRTQDNAVVTAPVSGGGGGGGSSSTPTTTSSAISVSSSGGTVSTTLSSGSSASVAIPSGAVSESTSIMVSETTLAEQNSAPLPSAAGAFIGNSIFKMEATSGGASVTQFNAPLTLTFGYTASQLGVADASKLRIAYFDTASGVWVALASTVDSANRKVSASTDHFTLFGLAAFANPPADGSAEGQVLGSTVGVYPNGALLKAPTSPAVWYISGDQKRLIRSAAIFESRFNWDDIITLPSSRQLDLYEQGDDVKFAPAALVKIMGEPAVYRVSASGDSAPIVSEEVFQGRGYSFGDVVEVESSLLANYPKIAVIDSLDALYDGDLVKLAGEPAVYYIEDGAARVIPSSSIFHERAFVFKNVATISQSQFDGLAIGSAMTYPDGTLVKGDASSVYVVADGKKRPIASAADFEALLYRWNSIIYVPESLLAAIPAAHSLKLVSAEN